ncbi:MAG TPA: DUF4178 domain-containing protein [Polyangia bacterium]|nr:DUF4178 domain-containing protein [Polyangia bacterium]
MPIHIRDVLSFSGRDYIVEGTVLYRLAGKTSVLARAVDGPLVAWVESPADDGGHPPDRLLVLHEVRDLDLAVPPPECIDYHRQSYVQRLAARATIETDGAVPEHTTGSLQVWRYRAAGDLYLQIEEGAGRVFMMAGESVPRGMIDHLPGR